MSEFEDMKEQFESLCHVHMVPVPRVSRALATDRCDYTSSREVRLNLKQEADRDYHVRHVFGHYLCDLHEEKPDLVADVIAGLVE